MNRPSTIRTMCATTLFVVLGVSTTSSFADETTISQPVAELRYNADNDYTWFIGAARWGAPSCPNAYYAQVPASVAGRKQILAIVLAAKAAGTAVSFQGNCSGDPFYFNVNYVVVGQ